MLNGDQRLSKGCQNILQSSDAPWRPGPESRSCLPRRAHATLCFAIPRPWHKSHNSQNAQDSFIRNAPSAAGNSMTGSERPSPEPLLKKEASPAVLGRGENSGNALKPSNALNYRAWGIPAILARGIPGKPLRALPGSFRNSS